MENKDITLESLKGVPSETISNPNLKRNKPAGPPNVYKPNEKTLRPVDPSQMLGLKSKKQIYRESNESAPPEEKVFGEIDKAIDKKMEQVQMAQEIYDQTEGEVTKEDLNDIIGFDPDELLKHPPRPGKEYTRVDPKTNKPVNGSAPVQPKKTVTIHNSNAEAETADDGAININDLKPEIAPTTAPTYVNEEPDPTEEEIMRDIESSIPEEYEEVDEDTSNVPEPVVEDAPDVNNVDAEGEDVDEPQNISNVLQPIPEKKSFIDRSEDDDLKALDDDEDNTEDDTSLNDHRMELLKNDVKKKITPTFVSNIAGFSIAKKPITLTNTRSSHKEAGRVADWVLPASERLISMRELSGPEIETLLSNGTARNKLNTIREQYQILYDHVVDPYKPDNVEAWAKLISVVDVDQLYAAVYRASFEGKNFIPYDCPDTKKCKNSFLSDNVPFMDMVKFKDNNAKNHFNKIINSTPTDRYSTYNTEVYPVSDVYAFGFREPSIYDVVFVSAYLDDAFIQKYQDIMTIAPYVDGMYYIDRSSSSLRPIYVKEYPNDIVKSTKAKIITLSKIVKDLSSDQFNMIAMYANEIIGDKTDEITFRIPETHCPKCGVKIEEATYTASQLLFLRHHLTALVNG